MQLLMIDHLMKFCAIFYLSSKTFSAAPSEYSASVHSVPSRCRSCLFWACRWGRRCSWWPTWAYPLCSAASRTAGLECGCGVLRKLRLSTACADVREGWRRVAVGPVGLHISCDGISVFVWVGGKKKFFNCYEWILEFLFHLGFEPDDNFCLCDTKKNQRSKTQHDWKRDLNPSKIELFILLFNWSNILKLLLAPNRLKLTLWSHCCSPDRC